MLPFLLLLVRTLTLYTAVSAYAVNMLRLGCVLPFILLLDGNEALYLAVCGNTCINTAFSRGTAAIFQSPYILDASYPLVPTPPPPLCCPLPRQKWCRPVTKLLRRAGCVPMGAPAGAAPTRPALHARDPKTRSRRTFRRERLRAAELQTFHSSIHPPARNNGRLRGRRSRKIGRRRRRCNLPWTRGFVSASLRQARRRFIGGALRARQCATDGNHPTTGTPATAPSTRRKNWGVWRKSDYA